MQALSSILHLIHAAAIYYSLLLQNDTAEVQTWFADYSQFLNKATISVSIQQTPKLVVAGLFVAFMALVLLASLTTSLTLRLPLIYYKQRRSTVRLLHDAVMCHGVCACCKLPYQNQHHADKQLLPAVAQHHTAWTVIISSAEFCPVCQPMLALASLTFCFLQDILYKVVLSDEESGMMLSDHILFS